MPTVLIIDDEQPIQKLIKRILENAGFETLTAANGNEGLNIYKQKHPDLVITDIVMPEKEGIETTIELKQINPNAKIIAISGGGKVDADSYLTIAKRCGATATIQKPIDRNELLNKVKSALSGTGDPGNK